MATKKPTASTSIDVTRPATFDLHAWAAGAIVQTATTQVTSRPDLVTRAEALQLELAQIETAMAQVEDTTRSSRRLAQKDDRKARLAEIEKELAQIDTDLDGTWLEVQFTKLTPQDIDAIRSERPKAGTDVAIKSFVRSGAVRQPGAADFSPMTIQDWERLVELIGFNQFGLLDKTCGDLSYGDAVVPDFSTRRSASQATATS